MKKSVVKQFEEVLRKEMSYFDDIIIQREDTESWTTIYVMVGVGDTATIYAPVIKNAIKVVDAYDMIYHSVFFLIETQTFEGGLVKPVIKINISRK